jgi:hypothetical protein
LLQKYGGLRWIDPDPVDGVGRGMCIGEIGNMEFQGGRNGAGWCLLASNEHDVTLEPWSLDVVIDLMADYEQPADMNVEIIVDEVLRQANQDERLPQPNKRHRYFRRRN